MAGFKNGKIMLPIKEFLIVKGQATYELNTIDMSKVTVFYRKFNEQAYLEAYEEMPKGYYRINEVGSNKQLEITNLDILDKYYSIQLCKVVDLTSSQYNPSGEIDVITLNQHLNEVITDVAFLFTYLKDVGMVIDSSQGNKILSELLPNTTWFMDSEGNMATLPVDELFEKLNVLVERVYEKALEFLKIDKEKFSNELKEQTLIHLEEIKKYTETKLSELKKELDYYNSRKKIELDEYSVQKTNQIKSDLDEVFSQKKQELKNIQTTYKTELIKTYEESVAGINNVSKNEQQSIVDKGNEVIEQIKMLFPESFNSSLFGNSYRGTFQNDKNYVNGDIYFKSLLDIIGFKIKKTSQTSLEKKHNVVKLNKFFRLRNYKEEEFNFVENSDNTVSGFLLKRSVKNTDVIPKISFQLNKKNYTVLFKINRNSSTTALIKKQTFNSDKSDTNLIKQQEDMYLNINLTQQNTDLTKINY